jgi:hypothetical protein
VLKMQGTRDFDMLALPRSLLVYCVLYAGELSLDCCNTGQNLAFNSFEQRTTTGRDV